MKNLFETYINSIISKFSHAETSEMGYRADFEVLLKGIFESINVRRIDHDARAREGNKPDFIVIRGEVPILYIEAKNIGVSLDKVEKSEQMARYFGYTNLVLTDYVEFRFYRNGLPYEGPIRVADYDFKNRTIRPISKNYEHLAKTLVDFAQTFKEPIKSGKHLAKIMGGKAQRIRDNVLDLLTLESGKGTEIMKVYTTIQKLLVHDLTLNAFADMYAQTLVYGLFVARYYDETEQDFSRREAQELIPASNPFLGHFFDHIAGRNFEKRLGFIVDELCEVFSHADVKKLMGQYFKVDISGEKHEGPDPVIHFYEDFLKEYDENLRKKMGAYYTPLPIVKFIGQTVDKLLASDFGLTRGLADTTKNDSGVHLVQVLDPAVGTGTFISTVIGIIYNHQVLAGQKGSWPSYVHHELLPRIYGFELMMSPYTIAHLKISMKLLETGFKYFNETRSGKTRLGVYLTNSLESDSGQMELPAAFGFAESIAEEAKEASKIKNEKPIMVVIGNPPYSVSSSNKGKWITNLTKIYKTSLNEKNIQPLSDDYIKFIRFAEHFIEKNGSGIVAMITNNSFLNGIIHRQMRRHLLETFDDIYILDLHGSTKKKERTPEGNMDENVFNIEQGVSVNIFVRNEGNKKSLGNIYHYDLFGKRKDKFKYLYENDVKTIKWQKLDYLEPTYFFVPKDFSFRDQYEKGFKIDELFGIYNAGSATGKDSTYVKMDFDELTKTLSSANLNFSEEDIIDYLYRPFDTRKILYNNLLIQRLRIKVMDHMKRENIALLTCKSQTSFNFQHIFLSRSVTDRCSVSLQTGEVGYVFPLYLYADDGTKIPNLKEEIVDKIGGIVGKTTPEEIFDYAYAVLHSPNYRDKYKEFLKIDFPRVPYPKDKKQFKSLVNLGAELRHLHLLESPRVSKFITTYPVSGSDDVTNLSYNAGKVFINKDQYFGKVPEIAWNFYIGGYQPAQKWLKDRKGRILTNEDIEHYQKIILALTETTKIMKEIDKLFRST